MSTPLPEEQLERGLGLSEAVALNMNAMVGIGPFIVIPLVIQAMGGPQCLLAWLAGAVLSLLDGLVWAELGAAMPRAGGTYAFLREIYGPGRGGRLMSFLYIWQTLIQAPLVVASGAIGFSQYLTYLVPLGAYAQKAISAALVVFLIVLLYRKISAVGLISKFLWIGVVGTMLWMIWGGATHFSARMAFDFPPGAWNWSWLFFAGLGSATINTIYTYLGYYHICNLARKSAIRSATSRAPSCCRLRASRRFTSPCRPAFWASCPGGKRKIRNTSSARLSSGYTGRAPRRLRPS